MYVTRRLNPSRILFALALVFSCTWVPAGTNRIADPGFETFEGPDVNGIYSPGAGSPWTEYGWGVNGFRQNRTAWTAPSDLLAEGGLGARTPGSGVFTGTALPNNRGTLYFRQNVTSGIEGDRPYEAWVWIAGNGGDVPRPDLGYLPGDQLEESCGLSFTFFSDPGMTTQIEEHSTTQNYWGNGQEFVRMSMRGVTPAGAVAMRVDVSGMAHGPDVTGFPASATCEVALDNVFFGYLDEDNLLQSPGFEDLVLTGTPPDPGSVDWTNWITPSALTAGNFPVGMNPQYESQICERNAMTPYDGSYVGSVPDLGDYSMCYYGEPSWGGTGSWVNNAFTMTQYVDWPGGDTAYISFYWLAIVNSTGTLHDTAELQVAVESRLNGSRLGDLEWSWLDWPRPPLPNVDRYDNNMGATHVRLLAPVQAGADEVGLHVRVIHLNPGSPQLRVAVDDFYLAAMTLQPLAGIEMWQLLE